MSIKDTLLHSKNVYAFNFNVNDLLHYYVESITERLSPIFCFYY